MTIRITIHNGSTTKEVKVQRATHGGPIPLTVIPPDMRYSGVIWAGGDGGMIITEMDEPVTAIKPDKPKLKAEAANDQHEPEPA